MTAPDFDDLPLDWLRAKPGCKWAERPDVLNAWVADMDFRPPAVVTDALQRLLDGGDFGYPTWGLTASPAVEAFVDRAARRYGWRPDADGIRELNDVTQGIQIVLEHHTRPGDGVVVLLPSYPPFLRTVQDNGRRLVPVIGERTDDGWVFDYDALEDELRRVPAKVFLLCHPHNPTGHVLDDAELQRIVDIAERHDLLIISDEIHADLTYDVPHRPIAPLAPARTVTLHAASKAFNLAGLRYALMHVGPAALRTSIASVPNHLYGEPNLFGATAAHAAWTQGDEWLTAVLGHLDRQRRLAMDLVREQLPGVRATLPGATYLLWLDCREAGFGDDPWRAFMRRGVRLSPGPDFGPTGAGHVRLNIATSSAVLREIVTRMATPPAP